MRGRMEVVCLRDILDRFSLKGKAAIITGGGRGIGKGITSAFCQAGAKVLIVGSAAKNEDVARQFRDLGFSVYSLRYDLSRTEGIATLFDKAVEMLDGRVDILVNNAGIQKRMPAEKYELPLIEAIMNVNWLSAYLLCIAAGRHMLSNGGGKIINLASANSFFGGYNSSVYSSSKGAIAQMTKALSNEWAGRGINVNAIAPGAFLTDMTKPPEDDPDRNKQFMERVPMQRWGNEEDIIGPVLFLASSASDYVSGIVLPVDGGYSAR